jgi:hypothetical protein
MGWNDDVVFGESVRGMQDSHMGSFSEIGAAQKLAQVRGALAQLAGNHFAPHAPVSKQMRSPYKDSGQISVSCSGTFTPQTWGGSALPTISGASRVFKSFKPNKAILTETITVVFQNSSLGARTKATTVVDSADLILTAAFSGADNCFPNAPNEANGIHGPALANVAYGNGISWPTINGGIDMTVTFAIDQTVLFVIDPPAGYTQDDILSVKVVARFALWGPQLR